VNDEPKSVFGIETRRLWNSSAGEQSLTSAVGFSPPIPFVNPRFPRYNKPCWTEHCISYRGKKVLPLKHPGFFNLWRVKVPDRYLLSYMVGRRGFMEASLLQKDFQVQDVGTQEQAPDHLAVRGHIDSTLHVSSHERCIVHLNPLEEESRVCV